jgi:hypothetical protein
MGFLNSKSGSHWASQMKSLCLICEDECESDLRKPLIFVNPIGRRLFIYHTIYFFGLGEKFSPKLEVDNECSLMEGF